MLHHLFVNISLCISKRDCSCLKCNYNSIISPEKLTIMLPHRAPRTCWNCHDTLLFTICLNKDYALQVSLDYCVIQQGWIVPLWWTSHCPDFCLSVFRWWLPFLILLSAETSWNSTWASAQAQQWSYSSWQLYCGHVTARCLEETAIRQHSYLPGLPSSCCQNRGLLPDVGIMALRLLLLKNAPSFSMFLSLQWMNHSLHWRSPLEMQQCVWLLILYPLHLLSPAGTNRMRRTLSTHICLVTDIPSVSHLNWFHKLLFSCHHYPT